MVTLSIVMAAYNEAANIEPCVREWYAVVVSHIPDAELVVVDDCSRDDTGARLERLGAELPRLRPMRTPQNLGHGRALRLGLDHCTGQYVFQTDSDRQHTPNDFWALWAFHDNADFIFGERQERADGLIRATISSIMRVWNFLLWGRWIRDANCPFKLMRRHPLDVVLRQVPRDSFIPMVMIAVLARYARFRVREVPVRHFARTAGEQSLRGITKWASVGPRCVTELLRLRLLYSASLAAHGGHTHGIDPAG